MEEDVFFVKGVDRWLFVKSELEGIDNSLRKLIHKNYNYVDGVLTDVDLKELSEARACIRTVVNSRMGTLRR
jgi:hypothetical protein